MSDFAENLRKALFDKHLKAIDIARGTNITPSVISRYLSGTNQPSRDNLFAVANYLGVSSEWLLSSSEAPESIQKRWVGSSATEPLYKTIEAQGKVIALQEELIKNLEERIEERKEDQNKIKELEKKLEITIKLKNDLLENLSRRSSQ